MIKTRAFALLATAVILCGTCQFGTSDQGHRTERTPDFKQLRAELNFELAQPCVMAVGTGHFLEIPVKIQSEDVSIKWVNWKKSGPNIDLWLVLESAGKNETKDHRAIVGIQDVNRRYNIRYLNPDGAIENLQTVVPGKLEEKSAEKTDEPDQ